MKYRSVNTAIWVDDAILELSPEQKLTLLYLHTNPYASACGIYKMQVKTMAFQIGMQQEAFESALIGLCAASPDFVQVDWDTMEVALLQYPKQTLIQASPATLRHVSQEIEKVKSQILLRAVIAKNSATLSKPYLSQLRRLQMISINDDAKEVLCGDVTQVPEIERIERKKETEKETEREKQEQEKDTSLAIQNPSEWIDAAPDRVEEAIGSVVEYLRDNPDRWHEIASEARRSVNKLQFYNEMKDWLRWNAENYPVISHPVKALTSGRSNFISWLKNDKSRKAAPSEQIPSFTPYTAKNRTA